MGKMGKAKPALGFRKFFAITVIVLVFGVFVSALFPGRGVSERGRSIADESRLKNVMLGCRMYALDYDGDYPPNLRMLFPDYVDEERDFVSRPISKGDRERDFIYRSGFKSTDDPTEPILLSPSKTKRGKRGVGFADGEVKRLDGQELEAVMAKFEFEEQ